MTDYPMTFAEWGKYAPDVMTRGVINAMIEDRALLRMTPAVPWSGGQSFSWVLNGTLPTISAINETSALTATKPVRKRCTTYLSQYGGDIQESVFIASTMDAAGSSEAADVADLARSMGDKLAGEMILGNWMTEANVTVHPHVVATPFADTIVAVSANMPSGIGWVKYVHSGTLISFKAPGSTTYGATQSIAGGDGNFTMYDGDDTTKYVTITADTSDFTGGAANLEIALLEFQRPEEVSGLYELAQLDSGQVVIPSTNGDAVSLVLLDQLMDLCKGPNSEKAIIANAQTVRNIMALYRAAGGATPGDMQRIIPGTFNGPGGIPIIPCPDVAHNETQGSASSSCGRIYCVHMNAEVGFHLIYGAQRGPNTGVMGAVDDADPNGNVLLQPVYMRRLAEDNDYAVYKWRATASMAVVLKRSKACAMAYGITN